MSYTPIADYAVIGDCRSAALVSRNGSIDWLCFPRFDSPSVFAALLDSERGGRFRIGPASNGTATRRYLGHTNVLETTFETATGVLVLTDAMPVADEQTKTASLWPDHEVLRRVHCAEGQVEVTVTYEPRPNYGDTRAILRRGPHQTIQCEHGAELLVLRSDIPLSIGANKRVASGGRLLRCGERAIVGLTFAHQLPAVYPADGEQADRALKDSIQWWSQWASQCSYDWNYREAVLRSALTLKALTYAPSGAMVAAATTSLPEKLGGVRNWDYRYCWLRDSSLTLRALVDLGYREEAEAFLSWVLHATALTQPRLQVLYDIYGEVQVGERQLKHLAGYGGARPVRIGNGAADQLQLDVYGEVVEAAYQYMVRGGAIDASTSRLLAGLGETVCRIWREPDEGIWEPRSGKREHTHSRMMCWTALDRLVRLCEEGRLELPSNGFTQTRDAIRQEIETRAWNDAMQSYVAVLDGADVDSTALRFALTGYADAASDRMRQTMARIDADLGTVDGLLYRYKMPDGLPPGEGTFVICGFWAVESLARAGRMDEATDRFERLLEYTNDVGLMAEEVDPDSGALLGNFPQAFSHVGLINAALTLAACAGHPQIGSAGPMGKRRP